MIMKVPTLLDIKQEKDLCSTINRFYVVEFSVH